MKPESENKEVIEELPEKVPQRGIYLIPNLLTTAALFAGFYSIVAAMKGYFDVAAMTIFIAMLADGLDGRVARLMNAQTPFGAQYDSISDMVAFGVAPSLVIYSWSLASLGKIGWLIAFLYTAGTALRLARFNTQVSDKNYFQGLPCTAAPGVVAGMVWMCSGFDVHGPAVAIPAAMLTFGIAGLMVSTIRYSSFKSVDLKGRIPFMAVVAIVLAITAIALEPSITLFTIFFIYALSGPVMTLIKLRQVKKQRKGV